MKKQNYFQRNLRRAFVLLCMLGWLLAPVTSASAGNPAFTERTGAANPFNGVSVGAGSAPGFADLDGDGDYDAVVGAYSGLVHYYENTGSIAAPVYTERNGTANPFNGLDVGSYSFADFADLDGDKDLDAVIGNADGILNYYENTGSTVAPLFIERVGDSNPFDGVDVGMTSAPRFADLDNDGDYDVVVGELDGVLNYYENIGSALDANFTERLGVANPFNNVDVGDRSSPSFADLDLDGDFDAVIGENNGTIYYYENTGNAFNPVFTARTGAANPLNGVDVGFASALGFADLDNDVDYDAAVGEWDGNLNYFEYASDNEPPVLVSFTRQTPSVSRTNVDSLVFWAVFNETVQNVDVTDFSVNGLTTAIVTGINQINSFTYALTVSGGDLASFNGLVGLNLAAGQNITDLAGNPLPVIEPGRDETYTMDNAAPVLISFTTPTYFPTLLAPQTMNYPTNADSLVFRATFDSVVQNVDAADFAVNSATTAAVTMVESVGGNAYDVTVAGGDLASFNGLVSLNLAAGQNIADLVGNPLPLVEPGIDETYLVDNIAPVLVSFTRQSPAGSPTNADSLVFRVVFDEAVQNVGGSTFTPDSASTATGVSVNPINDSTYDVTISGGDLASFNGTVGLNLAIGTQVYDLAGNPLPVGEPGIDQTYLVDNTPPAVPVIVNPAQGSEVSDNTPTISGSAEAGSTVTVSESVLGSAPQVVMCTVQANQAGQWSCESSPLNSGAHTIHVTATDAAGNTGPAATLTFVVSNPGGTLNKIYLPLVRR